MNGHLNGIEALNGTGVLKSTEALKSTSTLKGTGALNGDLRSWEEQFLPLPLRLEDMARAEKISRELAPLVLDGARVRRVADVFVSEVEAGLRQQPSSLQMENTYLPELTDGTEEGVFLALDLGGTNFRVLLLELKKGEIVREEFKHYFIGEELRLGPGVDLFNFLADCVQDFVKIQGVEKESLSMGFTFSFPMMQHSINSGELITWTKTFKCSGMAGLDVTQLLQSCLDARGLNVTVQVLLNDTTGTLVAAAQGDRRVSVGVILGTGSNGAYMERASRVSHWESAHGAARDVAVDVEWGAFGDNGCIDFIKTDVDVEVDNRSLLVNSFTFEKYISGKYLGSVLSITLAKLARAGLFPAALQHDALNTADLSLFEEENVRDETTRTLEVLQRVAPNAELTPEDALVAQHVAQVISNRAAQLVSVCISMLILRMERDFVGVAVDGSVFKCHPRISSLMNKYIALLAPGRLFCLLGAEDGSGKGSALTAAIAARISARDATKIS